MLKVRCPRCATIIEAEPGTAPVCPNCGFGGPVPAPTPTPSAGPQPQPTTVPMFRPPPPPVGAPPARAPSGAIVLATTVQGKPRKFIIGLLLAIITLGIYAWVWAYKVFAEHDRQHGRTHQSTWFWVSLVLNLFLVGFIFYWVYLVKEFRNLNDYRQHWQLPNGITGLAFILWNTLGLLIVVGPFIGYYLAQKSVNEVWSKVYPAYGVPVPS